MRDNVWVRLTRRQADRVWIEMQSGADNCDSLRDAREYKQIVEIFRKALSDTDGEAWINEIKAEVWEEAAEESRDRDDFQMRNFCNAKAKALRSEGGERAT